MITFDFYEEIKISESPLDFISLKQKISDLYNLDNEQLKHIIISYTTEENIRKYISDDYDYQTIIPFLETYIINLEITDNDYYLIDEEKPTIKFSKFLPISDFTTKKEEKQKPDEEEIIEDFSEEYYETEYNEEDIKEEENESSGVDCYCCDAKNIKGIRYMCGVCDNFNLCEECEKKIGEDHGHPLLKIRNNDMCPISFSCTLKNIDD